MNATAKGEHERLVEGIVREILDALPTDPDDHGWTYRDVVEADLKRLSPVELADQFLDARELLGGLHNKAEALGVVWQAIHMDTLEWVEEAYRRAFAAAEAH